MEDEAAITRMADRLLAEVSMETLAVQITDREMARELLRDLLRAAHPAATICASECQGDQSSPTSPLVWFTAVMHGT